MAAPPNPAPPLLLVPPLAFFVLLLFFLAACSRVQLPKLLLHLRHATTGLIWQVLCPSEHEDDETATKDDVAIDNFDSKMMPRKKEASSIDFISLLSKFLNRFDDECVNCFECHRLGLTT